MSIVGQQNINIGLPNQSVGSDSLRDAFTKSQQNFTTLFACASSYSTFLAGNGLSVNADSSAGTVTFNNTGVTNIIAGTNIVIDRANGNVTISATGGGGGGSGSVTSIGITPVSTSRITVSNTPIVSSGNISIDLATSGVTAGTYANPTITVDAYGRVRTAIDGSGNLNAAVTLARTSANTASLQAGISTSAAGNSTTQASIATAKAAEALISANSANADAVSTSLLAVDVAADAASAATSAAQALQAAAVSQGSMNTLAVPAVALPYEVTAISGGVGTGTGGVPGTYNIGVSGGPAGFKATVTIGSDGKVASYFISNPGLASTNAAPTLSLAGVTGLSGATTPTATVGLIPVNRIFLAPTSDGLQILAWINSSGSLSQFPTTGTQFAQFTKAGADSSAAASAGSAAAAGVIGTQVAENASFVAQCLAAFGRFYATRSAGVTATAVGELFTSNEGGTLAFYQRTGTTPFYTLISVVGYSGAIGSSQLTMATNRLLGRTTASTGTIEELTVSGLLSLSGGTLTGLTGHNALYGRYSGDYISPMINNIALTTTTFVGATLVFVPLRPIQTLTIDRLELEVTVPNGAGNTIHLGIYADNNGRPDGGAVLARTTTAIDTTTSGIKNTGSDISLTLQAGTTYWIACLSSANCQFRAAPVSALPILGSTSATFTGSSFRTVAQTFGQVPTTAPTTALGAASGTVPLIRARVA